MKILITNDDGYNAEGIQSLYHTLSKDHDVTIVAPERERSSCGHGITLSKPIRFKEVTPSIFSCSGTPADCVLISLGHIFNQQKPDLVISGINHGANLGQDRYYSGTIAAAREASFKGIPSIAISLFFKGSQDEKYFDTASEYILELLGKNIIDLIPKLAVLNINVPNLKRADITDQRSSVAGFQIYTEKVIERTDARDSTYYWIGGVHVGHKDIPGSDCNNTSEGAISLELQDVSGNHIDYQNQVNKILDRE